MTPRLRQIEVGLVQNFCTVISLGQGPALLVDPAFEVDRLLRLLAAEALVPAAVLITHGHPDHIDGVPELLQRSGRPLPIYIGAADERPLRELCAQAGVSADVRPLAGDSALRLELGAAGLAVHALATPGHTPGGMCYHLPQAGALLSGDTLFVGSCGASGPPAGDPRALYRSLQRLLELPEETRIYPGHDYGRTPTSTIGWEREDNPALRPADEGGFLRWLRRR